MANAVSKILSTFSLRYMYVTNIGSKILSAFSLRYMYLANMYMLHVLGKFQNPRYVFLALHVHG